MASKSLAVSFYRISAHNQFKNKIKINTIGWKTDLWNQTNLNVVSFEITDLLPRWTSGRPAQAVDFHFRCRPSCPIHPWRSTHACNSYASVSHKRGLLLPSRWIFFSHLLFTAIVPSCVSNPSDCDNHVQSRPCQIGFGKKSSAFKLLSDSRAVLFRSSSCRSPQLFPFVLECGSKP